MTVSLTRQGATQIVSVELLNGVDGQGKPTYDTPVDIDARVIRMVEVVRGADGSEIRTTVSLWVAGTQSPLPGENDRIDLGGGEFVVVIERGEGRGVRNQSTLDHVHLKAREE